MKRFSIFSKVLMMLALVLLVACGDSSTGADDTDSSSSENQSSAASSSSVAPGAAVVRFGMKAIFSEEALARQAENNETTALAKSGAEVAQDFGNVLTCEMSSGEDTPMVQAGLDCDADGGVVQYTTPERFRGAFRNVFLFNEEGDTLQILAQTDSLIQSQVVDMTEVNYLEDAESPRVSYTGIYAEVYYFDLKMELNNVDETRWVRIYMSDDDFPAEGSLGHHQGDVILLDDEENVLGWAPGCQAWNESGVSTVRSEEHNGAGGTDSETGHDRGFFGDAQSWNVDALMQGPNQDVYSVVAPLQVSLESQSAVQVLMTFNVQGAWYFEDFDDNGVFSPGGANLEMCDETSSWAPLLPLPEFVISELMEQ